MQPETHKTGPQISIQFKYPSHRKNPAMPGDQRKGDDDPHHKSNNKRAAKETKKSKRPVKQECADQQQVGQAPHDASAVQNPAGRNSDDTGVRSCGDKNGCKTSPASKHDYTRGVLVWHRIKGFPWWPGIVVDETDVPANQKKVGVGQESIPRKLSIINTSSLFSRHG